MGGREVAARPTAARRSACGPVGAGPSAEAMAITRGRERSGPRRAGARARPSGCDPRARPGPDGEEVEAPEGQHREHRKGAARRVRPPNHRAHRRHGRVKESGGRQDAAQAAPNPERLGGRGQDGVEREGSTAATSPRPSGPCCGARGRTAPRRTRARPGEQRLVDPPRSPEVGSTSTTGRSRGRTSPASRGMGWSASHLNARRKPRAVVRLSKASAERLARRALRMRAPARHSATMAGIASGGSWRSSSMGTTASPRAWAGPAQRAAALPKLRDRLTRRIDGSPAQGGTDHDLGAVAAVVVSERDLQATADSIPRRAARTEARTGWTEACPFSTGTTMDRRRRAARGGAAVPAMGRRVVAGGLAADRARGRAAGPPYLPRRRLCRGRTVARNFGDGTWALSAAAPARATPPRGPPWSS